MPDFSDRLWNDPRVYPLIQVHAGFPDEPGRNAPQVGGKGLGTNYELRNSWDGKNPEAVAEMMAGWVNWFQEQYGQHGRGDLRYAVWLNGWGSVSHERDWMSNPRNAWALGRNPADALDAPISDQARVGSFYSAEGVRLNAAWSERFVGHLDSELARMDLPKPEALHLDLEGVFDLNKIAEWWQPALDDPRSRTEKIDGRFTLAELALEAPQFWPQSGTHARRNRPFVSWASGVAMRAIDHVLWEGMGRQARERWPDVKLSNFQLTPGTDAVPFKFEKIDMEYTDAEIRHMSHAAPTIYWLNDWAFENGNVSIADHLARYGGTATGDDRYDLNELNALVGMHRIDSCIDNGMSVVAWVRPPNPDKLDLERTARVIRHGVSRGVTEWIFWTGDPYDWKILIDEIDRQNSEYAMEGR